MARRRRRFQVLVDEAFAGNLSMAADELGMPVSTANRYYHRGPRRFDAAVVNRAHELTGVVPAWLLGETGSDRVPLTVDEGAVALDKAGRHLAALTPPLTYWRVERVVALIEKRGHGADPWEVFFAPLKAVEDAELYTDGKRRKDREQEVDRKTRSHLTHVTCDFWDAVLQASSRGLGPG